MILIDGKKAAAELREELKKEVADLKIKHLSHFLVHQFILKKNDSYLLFVTSNIKTIFLCCYC